MAGNDTREEMFILEFRGAAFDETARFLRAAYRLPYAPGRYGFRCARPANQGQ
jgi:hypothetical protein